MAEGTKVPSNGDRHHSLKNGHCKATENDKVETIALIYKGYGDHDNKIFNQYRVAVNMVKLIMFKFFRCAVILLCARIFEVNQIVWT